jgi:hypothetical protein
MVTPEAPLAREDCLIKYMAIYALLVSCSNLSLILFGNTVYVGHGRRGHPPSPLLCSVVFPQRNQVNGVDNNGALGNNAQEVDLGDAPDHWTRRLDS